MTIIIFKLKINEAEECSERIQNKINKLKTTHVDVRQTDEYKAVMLEINEINQKTLKHQENHSR